MHMIIVNGLAQFKMYLPPELIDELREAGEPFGLSAQKVAERVLIAYLPVYTTVNEALLGKMLLQIGKGDHDADI